MSTANNKFKQIILYLPFSFKCISSLVLLLLTALVFQKINKFELLETLYPIKRVYSFCILIYVSMYTKVLSRFCEELVCIIVMYAMHYICSYIPFLLLMYYFSLSVGINYVHREKYCIEKYCIYLQ